MSFLNVATVIVLWVLLTTGGFLSLLPPDKSLFSNPIIPSLLFFNNVNILVACWEISLGNNIMLIKEDYAKLSKKYNGREREGCMAFFFMPMTLSQIFDGKFWSKVWSTYSLYDPSYQNHESFGFFIDFGNGMSTIPPSILWNFAMVFPENFSPLLVGCIGIAMYWQVMYGTIIYVLSFLFNRRYEGKSILEVAGFVGISNCLWFFFPIVGIYASVCMLRDGDMTVFGRS